MKGRSYFNDTFSAKYHRNVVQGPFGCHLVAKCNIRKTNLPCYRIKNAKSNLTYLKVF